MLWAIMRGSFALAKTLWVRTETPLRAALLGHEICRKLLEEKARGEALGRQLRELMEHLLGRACGLLDNIADVEVARKVLQSKKGVCATLGGKGKIDASNIDIAIEFKVCTGRPPAPLARPPLTTPFPSSQIKTFIAHSHCQAILDEMWMGRTPEVGRVKLQRMEVMPRLWLALLSPRRVVTLMANDLNQENTKLLHALGRVDVARRHAFIGYFQIPLVKRATSFLFSIFFAAVQVAVYFQRQCGTLNASHFLLAAWILGLVLEEVQQLISDKHLYLQSNTSRLDQMIVFTSVIALFFRFWLSWVGAGGYLTGYVSVIDWIAQHDPNVRPASWYVHDDSRVSTMPIYGTREYGLWGDEDDPTARCEWSLELELQRLFAGMAMLATMVRMTDVYTFSKGAGILMVCIKEMAVNMYEAQFCAILCAIL